VELWLTDTEGKKVILDVLGSGKFFGELSMLAGETRSASATSEGKVSTLELSRTDFFDFLRRRPDAALDVLTVLGDRLKHTDDILRTRVSRNPNDALDERLSTGQRVADVIAAFSGSIPFLLINLVAFVFWIVVNTIGPKRFQFYAYPFQFLTMAVSLEAIFPCAGYLGHPFVENDGFHERMSQVASTHLGEGLPFMMPRLELTLPQQLTNLERPIGAYLRENLHYSFSGFNFLPPFLDLFLEVGVNRILFSADYPYASMTQARSFLDQLPVSPADREQIAHGNAERLLKL
jgi:Amidohydrolase/Cyclic nucleotide-binding domain/Protein of unknown function (DUF1003)